MKNETLVTTYLDYHAERARLMHSERLEDVQEAIRRRPQADAYWQACLDDGWTFAELEAAFARRFGTKEE